MNQEPPRIKRREKKMEIFQKIIEQASDIATIVILLMEVYDRLS